MNPTVIGDATLYCGDCLDVLKTLPENSVEACLTDPPYGLSQHSEADIRACMAAWLAGDDWSGLTRDGKHNCASRICDAPVVVNADNSNADAGQKLITFRVTFNVAVVVCVRPVQFDNGRLTWKVEVNADGAVKRLENLLMNERHANLFKMLSDGKFRLRKREGFSACVGACGCCSYGPDSFRSVLVRLGDDSLSQSERAPGVVAGSATELTFVLTFDTANATAELSPASGADKLDAGLEIVCAEDVGAGFTTGGLASEIKPADIGKVKDTADGTRSFDLLVHSKLLERLNNPIIVKKGFMGKEWDSWVPGPELWRELYRVLKPGAHLLVFAGTRTADLMSLALRLAGFECRDTVLFCFGSGFPKASDCGKNIDKMMGKERKVVGVNELAVRNKKRDTTWTGEVWGDNGATITAPATPEAAQWDGWKSALKPCYEPVLLFRKPLDGTIAETVLKWGTGGLNIAATRVVVDSEEPNIRNNESHGGAAHGIWGLAAVNGRGATLQQGRYPGNLIVSSDAEVERCFPVTNGNSEKRLYKIAKQPPGMNGIYGHFNGTDITPQYNDTGSASRFFQHCDFSIEEIAEMHGIEPQRIVYSGKASKRDRDEGCEGMEEGPPPASARSKPAEGRQNALGAPRHNHHATVKPTTLLRYLLKLITPPGATVIDPFIGSGSTGKAALLEGFRVIGIEREPEYFDIACARVAHVSPEAFTAQPSPAAKTEPAQGTLL